MHLAKVSSKQVDHSLANPGELLLAGGALDLLQPVGSLFLGHHIHCVRIYHIHWVRV